MPRPIWQAPRADAGGHAMERPTILIVDDQPNICEMLRRMLGRVLPDAPILTADGADAALDLLAGHSVQLLITDFLMPGMHGLQLARVVKARWPQIPVILM